MIWDCSGLKKFSSYLPSSLEGAKGIFFVYDISRSDSFKYLESKINEICDNDGKVKLNEKDNQQVIFILVGNKTDLEEKREVKKEEGVKLATEKRWPFFETSAKSNKNIKEIFDCIVKEINEALNKKTESKISHDVENNKYSCVIF